MNLQWSWVTARRMRRPPLGNVGLGAEALLSPRASAHDLIERVDTGLDIPIALIERCEPKSHQVRCAEVAHYAAFYQRLHDLVAVFVCHGHVTSSLRGLTRRDHPEAVLCAARLKAGNEHLAELKGFFPQ